MLFRSFIYVDYSLPLDALREELTRLLEKDPLWDKRVKVLQVTNASEKTMEVRALMSASSSGNAFDLRCNVREGLIKFVQDNYPQCFPITRVNDETPPLPLPGDGVRAKPEVKPGAGAAAASMS